MRDPVDPDSFDDDVPFDPDLVDGEDPTSKGLVELPLFLRGVVAVLLLGLAVMIQLQRHERRHGRSLYDRWTSSEARDESSPSPEELELRDLSAEELLERSRKILRDAGIELPEDDAGGPVDRREEESTSPPSSPR